jgi:hypothetical protein
MSPSLLSIFITISACTWLYTKLQKYSGNNTKQSTIAIAFIAAVLFFVLDSIISLIYK